MAHTPHSAEHHTQAHHHVVPIKTLVIIFAALIGLTILTVVTATQVDIGVLNLPLALAIASAKAILVVLFFMALKWDSPVNRLVAIMGVAFVAIFLIFTLFDTIFRGDFGNVEGMTIMEMEAQEEALRAREPAQLRVSPADFVADTTSGMTQPVDTVAQGREPLPQNPVGTTNEGRPSPPALGQ